MNELQIYNYEGNSVSFRTENDTVYLNATEMARPFSKRPNDYLNLQSTKEYVCELETTTRNGSLIITEEGRNGGSWFHEDLALDYAKWLNVKFRIWCNDRIKELLKHGITALDPEKLLNDPDFIIKAMTALKVERQARIIAQHQYNQILPKANAFDHAHSIEGVYSIDQAAKIIFGGLGRNKFIRILQDDGIFMKGKCEAYQKYHDEKLFTCKSVPIRTGQMYSQTFITHKGLLQLIRKYGRYGSYADKELNIAV